MRGQYACLCLEIHPAEEKNAAGSCCGHQRRERGFCRCFIHVNHEFLSEHKIVILELLKLCGQDIGIGKADTLANVRYHRPFVARSV